jgi:hypothetical protein
VSKTRAEGQDAVLILALVVRFVAWAAMATLSLLAAFVFDSIVLRGVGSMCLLVGLAAHLFIERRTRGIQTFSRLAPAMWAGVVVSAVLLLTTREGAWTPVFGIVLFLFVVAAARLTARRPRADQ